MLSQLLMLFGFSIIANKLKKVSNRKHIGPTIMSAAANRIEMENYGGWILSSCKLYYKFIIGFEIWNTLFNVIIDEMIEYLESIIIDKCEYNSGRCVCQFV